ncbi:MAG: NAD-dependent epimerase/dehydratase family protein [Candidatus Odinarchaeota archaeon]
MDGNILVTGSCGQIGTALVAKLRERHGTDRVLATDVRTASKKACEDGPFKYLDVLDQTSIERIIVDYNISIIFHLASILSAKGEGSPQLAYQVNMGGTINILEAARQQDIEQVIWPSSIAAFGPSSPRILTPNDTCTQPTTMYGISKVTGELLIDYYHEKFGLDGRAVRLPGIISYETLPGGGTTDYAVEIFYEAIKSAEYTCFVKEDTMLPMMYMPDCLEGLIGLAEADRDNLEHRVFNIASMSFSPGELANEIRKHIPEFEINYKPDFRQDIADSWPESIDDSIAREEWGWSPEYDLPSMTADMIEKLRKKLKA